MQIFSLDLFSSLHKFVIDFLDLIVKAYMKIEYNINIVNIGMCTNKQVYYIANETILSSLLY